MRQLTTLFLLLAILGRADAQVSFGQSVLLNDGWRFLRIDSSQIIHESAAMATPSFDDSRWRTVTLPHDWGVELPMSPDKGSCQGYLSGGIAWYRKSLSPVKGSRIFLYFEGVYNHSEVYLNGHLLGKRPSGFASFLYELTPHLRAGEDNVLAVRVDHSRQNDSRWYTGSGIYRPVWLVSAPATHLALWGTSWKVKSLNDKKAVVEVKVEITDSPPALPVREGAITKQYLIKR